MSAIEGELNDYLDSVKLRLKTFSYRIAQENYQQMYKDLNKLMAERKTLEEKMTKIEGELAEIKKQPVWEK